MSIEPPHSVPGSSFADAPVHSGEVEPDFAGTGALVLKQLTTTMTRPVRALSRCRKLAWAPGLSWLLLLPIFALVKMGFCAVGEKLSGLHCADCDPQHDLWWALCSCGPVRRPATGGSFLCTARGTGASPGQPATASRSRCRDASLRQGGRQMRVRIPAFLGARRHAHPATQTASQADAKTWVLGLLENEQLVRTLLIKNGL